jgi:putative nucleotidyltransferase-like protein
MSEYTTYERLFLLASSLMPDTDRLLSLSDQLNKEDWESVFSLASNAGNELVVFNNLNKLKLLDDFPDKDKYETEINRLTVSNILKLEYFKKISLGFNKIGVQPMPLKGIAFSISYPETLKVRWSSDLDILIPKDKLTECELILKQLDFSVYNKTNDLITSFGKERMYKNSRSILVDLHCRLFPWHEEKHIYKLTPKECFNSSIPTDFEGCNISIMDKPDELLYLAMISNRENNKILQYFCDLDLLIRKNTIDWDLVHKKADTANYSLKFIKILNLLSITMSTPVQMPCGSTPKIIKIPHGSFKSANHLHSNTKINKLMQAPTLFDRVSLIMIYLRWQCYKLCGSFRTYFNNKNNE